jgi:type I restriction enzyme S subunit
MMQKIFSQEIRFKGENGEAYPEWEFKILKDVAQIIDGDRGRNYPSESDFYDKEYCLFLNAKNVTTSGFNFSNNMFITKEKDSLLKKGKLQLHDIVLTTRGTVGNVAYFDKSVEYTNLRINSGMVLLRSINILAEYLFKYFDSENFNKQIKKIVFGSAQPQLTVQGINSFIIPIPSLEEQQKIANFLSTVDKKIEKEQEKLESLNQWKKGLIQQMFV